MACAAPPAKAPAAVIAMTCAIVMVALARPATANSNFTIRLDTPFYMASDITDRAGYDQQVMNMSGYITKVLFDTTIGNAGFPGTSVQYTVKKNLPSGAATVRQATDPTHIASMRNMKQPIKTNCDPTVYTCTRTPCGVIEMDYLSASTDDAGNINRHFVVTGSTPPLAKVELHGWSMCGPMFGYNSTIPAAVAAIKYPNSVLNYNGHSMRAPKISMPNNIVTKMNTYPRWLYNTTTDWIFGNKRSKTLVCSSKTSPPYTQTPKGLSYQVGVMPFTSRQVGDPSDKFNQNLFNAAKQLDNTQTPLMPLKNFTDNYADGGSSDFYRTDAFAALHRCVALKILVHDKIADNKSPSIHSPDHMHEPETVKGCPNTRPLAQATDGTKPAWGLNPNTYAQNKQTYGFWDTHATTDYDGSDTDTAFARNSVLWTDGSLERSRILNMGYRGTAKNNQKSTYGQLTDEHMRVDITNPNFGTGCMNELFMMENVSSAYTPQHFTVYYKGGSSVPPETNGYETWDKTVPGWFRISALQMFNRSRSDLKQDDPTMHYRAAEWDIWSVNSLDENGIRHLGAPTKKLKTGFPDYTNPPAASVFATNPGYCVLNRCMGGRRDTPTALAEQAYGRFGTDDKWLYDQEKPATSDYPDGSDWCNSLLRVQAAVKHINDSGAYGYGIDESFANWAHIGCNQKVQAIKDNSDDTVSSVHKLFLDSSTNIPVRISVIGSVIRGCNLKGTKSIKSNTKLWNGDNNYRTNGRSGLSFENDDSLNVVSNPTAYDYSTSNPPGYKIWKRNTKTYPNQVPSAKYGWEAWWKSSSSGEPAYTAYNPYWDGINYHNYSCPMGFKTGSGTETNEMQLSKNSITPYRYQMDIVCTQDNTPTDPADWTDNKRWWKQHQLLYSIEEVTECSTPVDEELYAAGDNPYEHSHRTLVRPVISTMMFKRDTPTAGADSYGRYQTPSYPGEAITGVIKYKMDYPHTYGLRDTEALIYTQYSDYQKGADDQSDSICPVFGNTGGT